MSRPGPALVALTVLGGALRFATLDLQSFDFDEAITVGPVLGGSFDQMLDAIPETESTPPLYYTLAWLWKQPFGLGEVGTRSLAALFGTALIPVAYGAARELAGARAGLIAAGLVAVNAQLLFYSQEARAYSLLALLTTLSFWAFVVARREEGTRGLWLWALASATALLTHYFAAFVVIPEALLLLLWRRPVRPVLLASAAVAAVGAALVPLAVSQADGRTDWISDFSLGERLRGAVKMSLTGEYDPTSNLQLLALALVLAAGVVVGLRRADGRERDGTFLALGLSAAVLAVPLAIDVIGREILTAKNLLPAVPLASIGFGCALGARRAGAIGIATAAVVAAGCLAITVTTLAEPRLHRPDYRGIAEELGDAAPGAAVLTPYHGREPLLRYEPGAMLAPPDAAASELEVVIPLSRGDADGPARPETPAPPSGFEPAERDEQDTFTRFRYRATGAPVPVNAAALAPLAPATPTFPPQLLVWP
ncbi:MAG TPA: glycosyltransferase family 39 protein [Thermoleophilaceae bacterium]|nr:glycosyltransferase family 39 protein [Thermoleophilaceae bacterium]